ncbi:MAG: EAL domain-containing protein [Thermaerobacter sp.]|nr:EAL domain-containing protein [Thermaerobacter sp.]
MAATPTSSGPSVRLDELTVALQPVLNLRTGGVYGFEALLRGPEGCDVNPPALFRRARREGWAEALEYRARGLAVEAANRYLRDKEVLFLNGDVRYPVDPSCYPHLVLEISEARNVDRRVIDKLQRNGLALFLDDYGVSHGNLSRLLEMQPTGIKVDRAIIQGISTDPRRYVVARALATLADDLSIAIVAEGIETAEDLAAVRRVGFGYGQGYFLGQPKLVPDRRYLNQLRHSLREASDAPSRERGAAIAAMF